MRLCSVVFKECWQDERGRWMSSGGYPLQMQGLASLFGQTTLVVARRDAAPAGGIPLPASCNVIALRRPRGKDLRRKIDVLLRLPYYGAAVFRHLAHADVVYAAPPGDVPMIGLVLGLLLRKKMIVRYAGSWHDNRETTRSNRIAKFLMRRFAGGRAVMFAAGEGDAPPAPGVEWLFSTALTDAELRGQTSELRGPPSSTPRLVYVGRLSGEKGVHVLIEALRILSLPAGSDLPILTLAGDGPERNVLEKLVDRCGLQARVRFAGQLDRPALLELLAESDICVQPSLTEGFSKAWLDAFSVGVPVLSSNVGAAASVIGERGERGWLVPPGEPQALADSLRIALTLPQDWPGLHHRCRQYAQARSLENWAARIGVECAQRWGMVFEGGKVLPQSVQPGVRARSAVQGTRWRRMRRRSS
jgi:glycosyltransferase involved in cell wall biosynthesis